MTINERIIEILKKKRIQQKDLAISIGVSPSTLNNWLKLNRSIPSEFSIPISEFLNVDIYWLLTGNDKMYKQQPDAMPAEKDLSESEKLLLENYRDMNEEKKEQLIGKSAIMAVNSRNKRLLTCRNVGEEAERKLEA